MNKVELFADYARYHGDPRNRLCHAIGIPSIVAGLMGLAARVHVGATDLAMILAIAVLLFYLAIDLRGAVLAAIAFAVLYAIGRALSWQAALVVFVGGWVFQLVGHRLEGTAPRFLTNAIYLLIGPLYMAEEGYTALVRRLAP